jgi:thioredoxin reductase
MLDDHQRQRLARHNIAICDERIRRLEGLDDTLERIVFESGASLARQALFLRATQRQRSDIALHLGCDMEEPLPGVTTIKVDTIGKTSVRGVYAAGDAATTMQQAIMAAANGAVAAVGLNRELLGADFG